MPKPYAIDLRWRIVWLSTAKGLNPEEISVLVCVSQSTIRRYLTLFERTGYARLENPGIFLDELKDKLSGRFGVTVHTSTICRALQFIGCTRQVIKHIPVQRSDEMRAKFMAEVSEGSDTLRISYTLVWNPPESTRNLRIHIGIQNPCTNPGIYPRIKESTHESKNPPTNTRIHSNLPANTRIHAWIHESGHEFIKKIHQKPIITTLFST